MESEKYPVIRLIIDPKIEEMLPNNTKTNKGPSPFPQRSFMKNCFICEKSQIENSGQGQELEKERAELLKLLVVNSEMRLMEVHPLTFDAQSDTTCTNCHTAMDAVWQLHKQMEAVIREIDGIVRKVRNTMEQREIVEGDGQIVDVSSSFGYFKKLEVNLVDDLNCETTASADQICTNRDKGVSGKSTNTEKMDEEVDPIPKLARRSVRCENQAPKKPCDEPRQKKSNHKLPIPLPTVVCASKVKRNEHPKKMRRQCAGCNNLFKSPGHLERHIRLRICENKKYRRRERRSKAKKGASEYKIELGLTITLKDYPFKCINSLCGQSFKKNEHLADHLIQCEKRACLGCHVSIPRAEFERHLGSCVKAKLLQTAMEA